MGCIRAIRPWQMSCGGRPAAEARARLPAARLMATIATSRELRTRPCHHPRRPHAALPAPRALPCAPASQPTISHQTPFQTLQAAHNKENDDTYGAYNKPKALSSWLDSNPAAKEAWLLILDPDMLLRHPIKPEGYDLQEDYAAAAYYDYLHVGVRARPCIMYGCVCSSAVRGRVASARTWATRALRATRVD